jgi:membrane fusion protein (multidrug efflux system)
MVTSSLPKTFAALAGLLALGCAHHAPPAGPLQVGVAAVTRQDVPLTHEWVGTVDGFVNAEIRPQVEGYLVRQAYKDGAAVRKGELLFQIDPRPFQAAADQAKAGLERDKASRDKARMDVERYTPLAASRAISQQELDNALSALRQAQATADASQAAYDRARLSLEWTRVVAPIAGVAGVAKAQVGDLVNAQRIMATVSTVDPVKVYFNATEKEYLEWARAWAGPGGGKGSLELVLSDGAVYPKKGDPYMADRNVDLKTGTILLAGTFANPGNLLRPGQYGKVRAEVGVARGALLIPQRAIWEIQGTPQVAVLGAGNHVNIRPIRTGAHVGPLVVVETGLQPEDRVVVEGTQKVSEGLLVNPVAATAAAGK